MGNSLLIVVNFSHSEVITKIFRLSSEELNQLFKFLLSVKSTTKSSLSILNVSLYLLQKPNKSFQESGISLPESVATTELVLINSIGPGIDFKMVITT